MKRLFLKKKGRNSLFYILAIILNASPQVGANDKLNCHTHLPEDMLRQKEQFICSKFMMNASNPEVSKVASVFKMQLESYLLSKRLATFAHLFPYTRLGSAHKGASIKHAYCQQLNDLELEINYYQTSAHSTHPLKFSYQILSVWLGDAKELFFNDPLDTFSSFSTESFIDIVNKKLNNISEKVNKKLKNMDEFSIESELLLVGFDETYKEKEKRLYITLEKKVNDAFVSAQQTLVENISGFQVMLTSYNEWLQFRKALYEFLKTSQMPQEVILVRLICLSLDQIAFLKRFAHYTTAKGSAACWHIPPRLYDEIYDCTIVTSHPKDYFNF